MIPADYVRRWLWVVLAGAIVLSLANVGLLDAARLARGAANIGLFITALFPPNPRVLGTVARAMLETVQIAFAGTMLGFTLALPLALGATHTLAGPLVAGTARLLLALIRTVPALLWGVIFVVAVGLGPAAGTLGIAFYSAGYLGKFLYETFDSVDPEVIEAVRSVGCNRLQLARYALLPEAASHVLAQLLFMFEYNVRASSIMGFVGAGGIGFYLLGYIQMLQYDSLMAALLVLLAVVVLVDRLTAWLRRLLVPSPAGALKG